MAVDDLSSGSFKSIRIHINSDRLFNLILVYTYFIILKESRFFSLGSLFFLTYFQQDCDFRQGTETAVFFYIFLLQFLLSFACIFSQYPS